MDSTFTSIHMKGRAIATTRRKTSQRVGWLFAMLVASLLSSCATTDINVIAPPVAGGSSQLARGRIIYVTKCAKCHAPEPVQNYTKAEWHQIMPEMVEETHLNATDAAAVMAYVESMSAR